MKQYTIFARTDEGQLEPYGYSTDKATALGNLILSMHHTVQMLEPEKYGKEQISHVITYGTMAAKSAIKDVARVEKLPLDISNKLCKAIPDRLPDGLKMNLKNAISVVPELREAESSPNETMRNTIKYAKMLEGNEYTGARKVLTAAAMTYVVAVATALANLLRFVIVFLGNSRRSS